MMSINTVGYCTRTHTHARTHARTHTHTRTHTHKLLLSDGLINNFYRVVNYAP